MSKINLILFNFDENEIITKELVQRYKLSEKYDVNILSEADEVFGSIGEYGNAIFIFKLKTKKHMQDAVFLMKSNKNLVKKNLFKSACVLGVKNKKIEQVLTRNGCKDILDENIHSRTLGFKLDFWSKSIENTFAKIEKKSDVQKLSSNSTSAEDNKKKKDEFKLIKALELESDFWIIKNKMDYKRILRSYLIKILGPSPYIGKWYENGIDPNDRQTVWKYKLNEPEKDDTYLKNEGTWFFHGSKPDFDWKVKRWNFSSEMPHLYFKTDNHDLISRISFHDGQVLITENSDFAMLREELILKSCDTEFNIASDGIRKEESESLEGDDEKRESGKLNGKNSSHENQPGHMQGKNTKDEADSDPLSGKTKGEQAVDPFMRDDKKSKPVPKQGALQGKSSTESLGSHYSNKNKKSLQKEDDPFDQATTDIELDPFSGKQKGTDEIDNDPFAGQGETDYLKPKLGTEHRNLANPDEFNKEEKKTNGFTENSKDPLSGKSSTDEYGKDPLSGKSSTDEIDSHYDNESKFQDKKQGGNLDGKSSTDEYGKDPLSGKSSTDEYGKDPLSGKSSTDEIDSHYDNESKFQDKKQGGNLDGKSSTDEYGKDPLSGKSSTDEIDSHYDNESKFQDKKQGGNLDGKSSTDEYGKDPLSGKSSTDEYGKDPLSGKSSTDEIDSHYDNESKFQDKKQGGNLDGKSSTDEYGKDPLSGKSSTDEYGKDPLAGKTKTDSLESHMSNKDKPEVQASKKKESAPDELLTKEKKVHNAFDDLSDSNPGLDPLAKAKLAEAQKAGLDLDAFDDLSDSNPGLDPLAKAKLAEAQKAGLDLDAFDDLSDSNPGLDPLAKAKLAEAQKAGLDLDAFDDLSDSNPGLDPLAKAKLAEAQKADTIASPDTFENEKKKSQQKNGKVQQIDQLKVEQDHFQDISDNQYKKDPLASNKEGANLSEEKSVGEQKGFKEREDSNPVNDPLLKADESAKNINKKKTEAETKKLELSLEKERMDLEFLDPFENNKLPIPGFKPEQKKTEVSKEITSSSEKAKNLGVIDNSDSLSVKAEKEKSSHNDKTSRTKLVESMEDAIPMEKSSGDVLEFKNDQDKSTEVNTESGKTKVYLYQKTGAGNPIRFICGFIEFYEDELIVSAPKNSLSVDSEIMATVILNYSGEEVKVSCRGNLEDVDTNNDDPEIDIVTVNIKDIDEKSYNKFMELYEERQESIDDFMQKARGY